MEHFKAQFNYTASVNTHSNVVSEPDWSVTLEPPMNEEITLRNQELKRGKASDPGEIPPAFSKDGGVALVQILMWFVSMGWTETHSIILGLFTDYTDLQERL